MVDDYTYVSVYELCGRVEALEKQVADLEAKTEPLQTVTNALNEFRQRLDALEGEK